MLLFNLCQFYICIMLYSCIHNLSKLHTWNVAGTPFEDKLKLIIAKGDCSISFYEDILKYEWKNQVKEKKNFFPHIYTS